MRSAELVWVARTIACCGEIGGIGCRCEIARRRVRPSLVVIVDPVRDLGPGMIEAEAQAVGECQESCVRGRFSHHALTNLSSNMMANWVLASHHSRGGIFHVCA